MHTTRRHPAIFSRDREKQKKSPQRPGTGSSQKFLSVIIREKIRRFLSLFWGETREKSVKEKP
jgi:hypothetical protein